MRFWIILTLVVACAFAEQDSTTSTSEVTRQGRDYYPSSYYAEEEKAKYPDYPPSNYITYKDDIPANCPPSPLVPVLSNGLNFLLLKLGALGLIKSVIAVVFVILLFKLPIFLAKAAFIKALFFPAILAPLMMLFSGSMSNMMNMMKPESKPGNTPSSGNTPSGSGRSTDDPFSSAAWQSLRLLMDSEKCIERMACQFGVLNNDTASGTALARMAKYIEHSSPAGARIRIRSLRDAFSEGNTAGTCPADTFPCQAPHLFLKQGEASLRIV